MRGTSQATQLLLLLSEYHPVVIEGSGSYDLRDPLVVASRISRSLKEHWSQRPPTAAPRGNILVIQGDPLAERGISAITRAVAMELGLPRCLVVQDDDIDETHSRDADRHGVEIELRFRMLASLLDSNGSVCLPEASSSELATARPNLDRLTQAIEGSILEKNEARRQLGKPPLKSYYRDSALLQEMTKAACRVACGGITVAHTAPAAEISPFSVTSFYEIGLELGHVSVDDMVSYAWPPPPAPPLSEEA